MKTKITSIILAAVTLFVLAACSDYENGFTEKELKYIKDFKALYGEIDAKQDWNIAERATVTVTVGNQSEVKVYAKVGGEYAIVADYPYVRGTEALNFDVPEGTTKLMVSNGVTAIEAEVGGTANFVGGGNARTRTVYEGNGYVSVSMIEDAEGITIGDVTYPKYKYATETDISAMKRVIPEIGHRETFTNLTKVTHDFQYVSTGKLVIYPYYWVTSSANTIGIYYNDEYGVRQMVDIYTIKEGGELVYENITSESPQGISISNPMTEGPDQAGNFGSWGNKKSPEGWTISNGAGVDNFHYNGWSTEADNSGMQKPFIEYWRPGGNNLQNGTIKRTITGLEPGSYAVYIDVRAFNEGNSNDYPTGMTFSANGTAIDFCAEGNQAVYNGSAEVYYNNLYVECTVETDGKLELAFNLNNVTGNWLAWKNIRVVKRGAWESTDGRNSYGNVVKGQGFVVDIPAGTTFGMYLKKGDRNHPDYIFYSQSELNDPAVVGAGVTDDGMGNVTQVAGLNPCYASSFHVGSQMFLGFEDWPNDADESDFDLNDVVLAFAGATPHVINEDPEPAATWLLACEDLGGTFDTDYNDIVLKIEHVSGKETATVTPLAAGGTLASYIFFEDPTSNSDEQCLGEIHQLFGKDPQVSGDYHAINVGVSRGNPGASVTINVSPDWTMAHYTVDDFSKASQYSKSGREVNMGGFGIYVLPKGTAPLSGKVYSTNSAFGSASIVAAPDAGNVPEMLCIPYTYTQGDYTYVWAWPREFCTIADGQNGGAYPEFAGWVNSYTNNLDWYMHPITNTVSELKWKNVSEPESNPEPFNEPVLENKTTPTLGGIPFIGGTSTNVTYTGSPQYFVVPSGKSFWMKMQVNGSDYNGTGSFTATINDGGTGSSIAIWNGKEINFTAAGSNMGTAKVTIYFSGDGQYNPTSVTYYFSVPKQVYFKSHANATDYGLAIKEGKLADIAPYDKTDATQTWYMVKPINEKGQAVDEGSFWLYNAATKQFVEFDNNSMALILSSTAPVGAQSARFRRESNGWIWEPRHKAYYLGLTGFIDGGITVGLLRVNKDDSSQEANPNIIPFTIE